MNKIVEINQLGVSIACSTGTILVRWPVLRAAAKQPDQELRLLYRDLLEKAEELVRAQRPTAIMAAEINTNVFGSVGVGVDGIIRPIRAYSGVRLRADEGLDLYRLSHAESEADNIRNRNRL